MKDDVFVEERGGELEESEGEGQALRQSRLIAEAEDVGFDLGRDVGKGKGGGGRHAEYPGSMMSEEGCWSGGVVARREEGKEGRELKLFRGLSPGSFHLVSFLALSLSLPPFFPTNSTSPAKRIMKESSEKRVMRREIKQKRETYDLAKETTTAHLSPPSS